VSPGCGVQGCCAMQSSGCISVFQRNITASIFRVEVKGIMNLMGLTG
jgi:hypothetical protein